MVDKDEVNDVLQEAKDKFEAVKSQWSHVYDAAAEDLHFLSDADDAQWEATDFESRKKTGRPTLTIDQLGQFVNQVVNDIRMNTPTINVIPSSDGDIETAEMLKGLIRNIEYESNADIAYDTAAEFAVKSSLGFIRIDHDYEDTESFNQKLMIKTVVNPHSVYLDSNSIEPDGSDAKCAYVLDTMSKEDFEEKYPNKAVVSFTDCGDVDDKHVVIAEYFYIEDDAIEIGMLEDGTIEKLRDGIAYIATRKTTDSTVRRYKMSGEDILEESTFPGKYIPIVPVYGALGWNKGKRHVFSLIRKSKDGQRLYNYWRSMETELLMKQPKATFMAAVGQTEDFADDYLYPDKAAMLRYKQVDALGQPAPAPHRIDPPAIPTGIVNAARETVEDIKATMGMYNASLGQRSNETSGVAIAQRKQEGDVATFHFGDNLVRSITQVGKILVSAIPVIYDTPRVLNIIGEEEESKPVGINGAMVEEQKQEYDVKNIRKYGVKVTTGASFTTQRQEATAALGDLIKNNPDAMMRYGDIFFKNSDFAGAQALAKRAKKMLPPELQDDEADIDPQVQQMQAQLQQAQDAMGKMQQALQDMQAQVESKDAETQIKAHDSQTKAQAEQARAENESKKLEIEIMKLQQESQKIEAELALKQRELDLKEQELHLSALDMAARNQIAEKQSQDNSVGVSQGEFTND